MRQFLTFILLLGLTASIQAQDIAVRAGTLHTGTGSSMDNAVVVDDNGVMNPEGLRYHNEFVRHKILDSVGDFSLLGAPLLGHIRAFKAGHDLNSKMVKAIEENPDHWVYVDFTEEALREAQRVFAGARATELVFNKA